MFMFTFFIITPIYLYFWQYEMEKIFVSLCNIVEASETDQTKRNRKLEEKATLEERIRAEREELLRAEERDSFSEREE